MSRPVRTAAALLIPLLLGTTTACSATHAVAPPATPTSDAVQPTTTSAAGCPRTATTLPEGALTARIGDVDGDGRADREWARLLEGGTVALGVTTASGATIGAEHGFAGGGERSAVVGTLGDGRVVALASEGRASYAWTLSSCAFHQVRGVYDRHTDADPDQELSFSSVDSGGAAGCLDGRLVGFHVLPDGTDRVRVTAQTVTIAPDGVQATTGSARTLREHVSVATTAEAERVQRTYGSISCGGSTVLRPIVR